MKKIFILFSVTLLFACSNNEFKLNYPADKQIVGLASPIQLEIGKATVLLTDYFLDVKQIDSLGTLDKFKTELSEDKSTVKLSFINDAIPVYSQLKVWIKNVPYSILLAKSRKIVQKVVFNPGNAKYGKVQLSGEFNNWNAGGTNLNFKDSIWLTYLTLDPGKYAYKVVADGKELVDEKNLILKVGKQNAVKSPILSTLKPEENKIVLNIENKLESIFVFWQNYQLPENFIVKTDSTITISIPAESSSLDRSFLRVWAYNQDGKSNDLLIPLAKDEALVKTTELTRNDKEASIFYFMMIDRFNNGSKENDKPIADKDVDFKANYQGGDLNGITKKITDGYFEKMGINTLWLSPITQNPVDAWNEYPAPHRKFSGYHGYWPISLTTVDKRFGTSEEFKELLKVAHDKNMNVIMDFVSHHVHQSSKLIQDHPDWKTELKLPNGKLNLRIWDDQRLTTWFDPFLPTFDLSKPEVAEAISDTVMFWVKNYEIDGFRHDATKHIPENYWRLLTQKLKKEVIAPQNRRFYQIGETFGSRELIGSYVNSGQQDGQFDFNLYFDARDVFAQENQSFERLNNSLMASFDYYGCHNLMGNITGNHDLTRFISFASGAVKFNEDDKEAGWKRNIQVENPNGYLKLSSLTAFIMTIPGIPVVFYGDEFGMPGAGDPDNRRMMKFDGLNKDEAVTFQNAQKLVKIRAERLELMYGDFKTLKITNKEYAYIRSYFGAATIVVLNKDSKPQQIEIELPKNLNDAKLVARFGSAFSVKGTKLDITVPAFGFEILTF